MTQPSGFKKVLRVLVKLALVAIFAYAVIYLSISRQVGWLPDLLVAVLLSIWLVRLVRVVRGLVTIATGMAIFLALLFGRLGLVVIALFLVLTSIICGRVVNALFPGLSTYLLDLLSFSIKHEPDKLGDQHRPADFNIAGDSTNPAPKSNPPASPPAA